MFSDDYAFQAIGAYGGRLQKTQFNAKYRVLLEGDF